MQRTPLSRRARTTMVLLALASLSAGCGSRVAAEIPADVHVVMDREPPPALDSAAPVPAPDVECPANERTCSGRCVDTETDVLNCGACGAACSTTDGGTETCVAGRCQPNPCPAGFHAIGDACVADGGVRPVQPVSLGDTTLRRPTLRFTLPSGADGAVIELCRDRACTMLIETLRVTATTARPSAPLPASSVVFWRARARVGAADDSGNYGPTWIFHTPARDNSNGVDSSFNPHFDVNGDGFDDVVIGAPFRFGPTRFGSASVFHGSSTGVAPEPARVLMSTVTRDYFGSSVANAGDINGDGFADLIVGAPYATTSRRVAAGTASVFYGTPSGIAATPARVLEGSAVGDKFGASAAGAGDVDGDGFADVIVGAVGADPGRRPDAGSASVFHGSASGIATAPARVLEGAMESDAFGSSVASAGDVNGDGLADVVVGARLADDRGRADAGSASVFHGRLTGVAAAPALVRTGSTPNAWFGSAVASAGDVNGDGFADVVIGVSGSGVSGQPNVESTYVLHGSSSGLSATPALVIRQPGLGRAVASAGDVNGDGFDDIAVGGAEVDFPGRERAGAVAVFHGSAMGVTAIAARVLEGSALGNWFGNAVARAGDVNRDGFADIVVGANGTDVAGLTDVGAASVFHGSASGVSATPARVVEGTGADGWFGASVASANTTRRPSLACSRADARSDAGPWRTHERARTTR